MIPTSALKNMPPLIPNMVYPGHHHDPGFGHDTNYLPYCTVFSRHTKQPIEKVYADKGYAGQPNRDFLALIKSLMASCEKIRPLPNSRKLKLNETKKSQKFDISLNNTSASVICTMTLKEQDLLQSTKTISIAGAVRLHIISARG